MEFDEPKPTTDCEFCCLCLKFFCIFWKGDCEYWTYNILQQQRHTPQSETQTHLTKRIEPDMKGDIYQDINNIKWITNGISKECIKFSHSNF